MLKRSSIRHSDPTLSQKRGELRHCGGIIPLFRENQSTRGLAALYSTRLPARSIAAVPVIDIYTRFGQTVSRLYACRPTFQWIKWPASPQIFAPHAQSHHQSRSPFLRITPSKSTEIADITSARRSLLVFFPPSFDRSSNHGKDHFGMRLGLECRPWYFV